MEQDQFQSYEEGTAFKPGHTVDVIPALDRINSRLNAADQEALAQVRRNNKTRVENSKSAGQDLIALSKMSKTLTDALVERQKGINEDEKAEGIVEGYQQFMDGGLDTTEVSEGMQSAKQQDGVAQDVSSEVLGNSGENYEAAAGISKATTWREVGRRQGAAMGAVAGYDSFIDEKLSGMQFNSSAEYSAARASAQKAFFKEAGLTGVKPQFLAQNVYPQIMKADNSAMRKWSQRFAIDDSAKTQDELFSSFSADKDVSSLLGALRNTVDGQGNPLGYKGAWTRFDKEIVEMRKAGLISALDVRDMQKQPIPGDAKGRTYGDLHGAKFKNIEKQVAAQLRTDWNNSEADRKMEFEQAEQELVQAYLDDPDGYTDDQIEDAKQTLRKRFGMNSSELETLKANTVDAETRRDQEEEIESLQKMGLLTPERLKKYDPKLQRSYMAIAQQQAKLSKETGASKVQLDSIKDSVEERVRLNKSLANHPAIGLMVAEKQREYQALVTKLAIGGDTNPTQNALTQILGDMDKQFPRDGANKMSTNQIIQAYSKATLGQFGSNNKEAIAQFEMMKDVLTNNPNAYNDFPFVSEEDLTKLIKGYGKPGFNPGATVNYIAERLNVDPLTVLNKQLELNDMDPLPPTPAMEVVNNLTPQQQQLLNKYKTPERSSRGLGGTGTFKPEVVPHGLGQSVQQSATKYNIPPSILAALLGKESGYQKRWMGTTPNGAGAVGIAQIIPRWHPNHTPGLNPTADIDYAAKYLREIMDGANQTGGPVDIKTALYMYNAGPYAGSYPNSTENAEYTPWIMKEAYKYGYGTQSLQDPTVMRPSIAAQIPS